MKKSYRINGLTFKQKRILKNMARENNPKRLSTLANSFYRGLASAPWLKYHNWEFKKEDKEKLTKPCPFCFSIEKGNYKIFHNRINNIWRKVLWCSNCGKFLYRWNNLEKCGLAFNRPKRKGPVKSLQRRK